MTSVNQTLFITEECIPVGCVPSAAVAISPATHACLLPTPHHAHPTPLDKMTDAYENITFPQLPIRSECYSYRKKDTESDFTMAFGIAPVRYNSTFIE